MINFISRYIPIPENSWNAISTKITSNLNKKVALAAAAVFALIGIAFCIYHSCISRNRLQPVPVQNATPQPATPPVDSYKAELDAYRERRRLKHPAKHGKPKPCEVVRFNLATSRSLMGAEASVNALYKRLEKYIIDRGKRDERFAIENIIDVNRRAVVSALYTYCADTDRPRGDASLLITLLIKLHFCHLLHASQDIHKKNFSFIAGFMGANASTSLIGLFRNEAIQNFNKHLRNGQPIEPEVVTSVITFITTYCKEIVNNLHG